MKKAGIFVIITSILIIFSILPASAFFLTQAPANPFLKSIKPGITNCGGDAPGTANPAAVYCKELGYNYQITSDQKGICTFPDKTQCDAWEFLQGICGKEFSYCEQNGMITQTKSDGQNPYTQTYSVCVNSEKSEIGSVVELTNLEEKSTKGKIVTKETKQTIPSLKLTLPDYLDWGSKNGINWITTVKNQGGCGSCWAFSAVGTVEANYNIAYNDPRLDLNLAEEYLVSDCHSYAGYETCCGGWHDKALLFIENNGIPDEGCMSYVDGSGCSCSGGECDSNCNYNTEGDCSDKTCSDRCSDWASRLTAIEDYQVIPSNNIEAMKQAIVEYGPISVSIGIGSDFGGYWSSGGIYRCTNDNGANHAVVIVGYNNTGQYWIIKNSWGSTWNGDGYFKMGYNECDVEDFPIYVKINGVPVLDPIGDKEVDEKKTLIIDINATDPNGDEPIYYTNAQEILPGEVNFDLSTGLFEYTPNSQSSGNYQITFNVTDGELWDYETINIKVNDMMVCGDVNWDSEVNVGDASYLINYIFNGGPGPLCFPEIACADPNGDNEINVADAVYLIRYIFQGGPAPVEKPGLCANF